MQTELGGLKYDSTQSNWYYVLSMLFFVLLGVYWYMDMRDGIEEESLGQVLIVIALIIPPCLFLSLAWQKTVQRFRIYSKGINIMAIRYEGNPHKGLAGLIKGRKKVRYENIVSIHPFSQVPLFTSGKRKGLTFMLPSGKKGRLAGQFGLKGEKAKEAIKIIKEQMGDLWNKKYREPRVISKK